MSVILPRAVAVFETQLAQSITSSDTTMYLVSALTKDGDELEANKWYGFVIDQGTNNEEFVIGQVDATNRKMIKNLKRGISYKDGQTEISSLKKAHNIGASVRITDAPILPAIVDAFNDAVEDFNNKSSNINSSFLEILYKNIDNNYTIAKDDFGICLKLIGNNNITVTIPTDLQLGIDNSNKMYKFFILKTNTGSLQIIGQSGVNIIFMTLPSFFILNNSFFLIVKNGQNNWLVY